MNKAFLNGFTVAECPPGHLHRLLAGAYHREGPALDSRRFAGFDPAMRPNRSQRKQLETWWTRLCDIGKYTANIVEQLELKEVAVNNS